MEKKNIFIKTFGCQMNEYDSSRIYDNVSELGFKKTLDQANTLDSATRQSNKGQ